jgi:hypothetical protein
MAFSDPQTINAQTCNRIAFGDNKGAFRTTAGDYLLSFEHTYGKRNRHTVSFRSDKIGVDPLQPTSNAPYSMTARFIVDVPPAGYTAIEMAAISQSLLTYLSASSFSAANKLLGGES